MTTHSNIPNPWSVPECAHLATEQERLKRVYALAVEQFFATGYRVTDAEHRKLKSAAETARIVWEAARVKLERHHRIHSGAK